MPDQCLCTPEVGSENWEVKTRSSEQAVCPTNRMPGKVIATQTVKAMLAIPLTDLHPIQYYFCRDENCTTVYYNANGQTFTESHLRERVYQKNTDDESVQVCYCFQHTPGSIRGEIRVTGKTTAIDSITAGIQAGQCACEIRNPQGSCCLGNVRALVKQSTLKH